VIFFVNQMKLKTSKSAQKRFKISAGGKISRRSVGINHFNAKEGGHETRRKRGKKMVAKMDGSGLRTLLPYDLSGNNF
jgi:ribosomal protein L35